MFQALCGASPLRQLGARVAGSPNLRPDAGGPGTGFEGRHEAILPGGRSAICQRKVEMSKRHIAEGGA